MSHRAARACRETLTLLGLVWTALVPSTALSGPRAARQKPLMPVGLELRVLDARRGAPVRYEARVEAFLPVEDLNVQITTPQVGRGATARPLQVARLARGEHRALALEAAIPASGHTEIQARVTFRLSGGKTLSRGAYLSFDDGLVSRPVLPRAAQWNGAPVLEYSASEDGR